MALYLPGALGPIARLCSSDNGRYSMSGVRVVDPNDGTFRCEVTDGRSLLIARGVCPLDDDAPGNFPATIPAGLWKDIFDEKVKDRRGDLAPVRIQVEPSRIETAPCILQVGVGIQLSLKDNAQAVTRKGTTIGGRFPDVSTILPKGKPAFVIRVNPHYLATLLEVLNRLLADEPAVSLAFWRPDQPMAIVAKDRTAGICYDALLMPLTLPEPVKPAPAAEAGPTEEEELADEEEMDAVADAVQEAINDGPPEEEAKAA
jgi:hypothetical protein